MLLRYYAVLIPFGLVGRLRIQILFALPSAGRKELLGSGRDDKVRRHIRSDYNIYIYIYMML